MYICINRERPRHVKPFGSIFLEIKLLCHETLPFCSFCFNFYLGVTWYRHVFHLWYRGKQCQSRKPMLYDLVCTEKQLRCKSSFYCVFIYEKGNDHARNTFNNSLLFSLSLGVYLFWQYFTMSNFLTDLFHRWAFMI